MTTDTTLIARAGGGLLRSFAHRLGGDADALPVEGELASFDGATGWLNSPPLTPDGLRGRVVLVNFWTYTCVNWLRTLPYVRAWNAKYADHGLTIVGIHTPEFDFERNLDNVVARSAEFGVTWPVPQDNEFRIWRAFSNHFWPAVYLADGQGRVRFHHFGEGEYAMTEMAIQTLLAENGATVETGLVTVDPVGLEVAADWRNLRSPETYLGYAQATGVAAPDGLRQDRSHVYRAPDRLPLNHWAPIGAWTVTESASVLDEPGGRIRFRFQARDVNLVMGPTQRGSAIPFRINLDGHPASEAHGTDVASEATGTVTDQRTYQLIRQSAPIAERTFEIEFLEPGVEALCFTFG